MKKINPWANLNVLATQNQFFEKRKKRISAKGQKLFSLETRNYRPEKVFWAKKSFFILYDGFVSKNIFGKKKLLF